MPCENGVDTLTLLPCEETVNEPPRQSTSEATFVGTIFDAPIWRVDDPDHPGGVGFFAARDDGSFIRMTPNEMQFLVPADAVPGDRAPAPAGGGSVGPAPNFGFTIADDGTVFRTSSAGTFEAIGRYPQLASADAQNLSVEVDRFGNLVTINPQSGEVRLLEPGFANPQLSPAEQRAQQLADLEDARDFTAGESALDRAARAAEFAATHGLNTRIEDRQGAESVFTRERALRLDALDAANQLADLISLTDPAAVDAFLRAGGGVISNAIARGNTALSTNAMLPAARALRVIDTPAPSVNLGGGGAMGAAGGGGGALPGVLPATAGAFKGAPVANLDAAGQSFAQSVAAEQDARIQAEAQRIIDNLIGKNPGNFSVFGTGGVQVPDTLNSSQTIAGTTDRAIEFFRSDPRFEVDTQPDGSVRVTRLADPAQDATKTTVDGTVVDPGPLPSYLQPSAPTAPSSTGIVDANRPTGTEGNLVASGGALATLQGASSTDQDALQRFLQGLAKPARTGGTFAPGVAEVHDDELVVGNFEVIPKDKRPSPAKAREMLRHGEVNGEPLTDKQRGLFGAIASGQPIRKAAHGGEFGGVLTGALANAEDIPALAEIRRIREGVRVPTPFGVTGPRHVGFTLLAPSQQQRILDARQSRFGIGAADQLALAQRLRPRGISTRFNFNFRQ